MSKKKRKNQNNKDVIVVLFILALIILSAVGVTMCSSRDYDFGKVSGNSRTEEQHKDNSGEIAILTATGVAVIIVICFAVKKANDAKKRNEALKKYKEHLDEQKRLEEARERVRQARLQEMIDAGINELTNKGKKRNTINRTERSSRWDDDYKMYDLDDEYVEEVFSRSHSNTNYDDLYYYEDELRESEKEENFLQKYWRIILGVTVAAVLGGVIIIMFVL